jgi:hypothetical protein
MSMPDHTDDPVAAAGAKVASYLSLATVAAEAIAQLAASRARERAVSDERTAAALRAQRQAAYSQARLGWAPILDPKLRERTGVLDAGLVWAKAQAWRPDPAAERASDLAEDRLRDLRPDVMERYDRLRAEGTDPVEAMRRVAPGFDAPPMWTGQPGPDRAALTERDVTRRPGDAEITRYRAETATAQPDTARGRVPAARTPPDLAGRDQPKAITAGSAEEARHAAVELATAGSTVQHRGAARVAAVGRAR